MKLKQRRLWLTASAAAIAVGSAWADDGEQTIKRMTGGSIDNQLNVLPEDVGADLSEAEHAYTKILPFYVSIQKADGTVGELEYLNVDEDPVETLTVAKPLVNVFIYGPYNEPEGTAFAHSWMEVFGAVSLDDGETWKTTNLSESADQSSFTLGQGGGRGQHATDSDADEGEGGHHEPRISVEVSLAEWSDLNTNFGKLKIAGEADPLDRVKIINFDTGETLFQTLAKKTDGFFAATKTVRIASAPCRIAAVADGETSAPVPVIYPEGSEVDCEGLDLIEYPGGVGNVIHAVAGNRVLVAWPSRYCSQGSPAYSYAYDGDDSDLSENLVPKRGAVEGYLQEQYPGFDVAKDLYLTDLFGVAGSQGSINFADEGYPQVGEVPFACLWTARGVLRPGNDPRTEAEESSHMVWTKPERLTSGRRDVNRVEIAGEPDVGFSITWQEDPDGLRPGQGEGPGEGWSGAIAHSKTDVWYSFIRWEDFGLVEDPEDDTLKVDIFLHDLDATGRPQVFVPMAVPMRLTNNDRCVADDYAPGVSLDPSDSKYFSYCNDEVAKDYGLQDFCVATVDAPQGQNDVRRPICVNEDGLPNLANTASTRARFGLKAYDSNADGVNDSAWMIMALEESKGLGRYAFLPDGAPCDADAEGASPDCSADIGKNQWYHSFDMGKPNTSETMSHPNGLVRNLVSQGDLLNQPEVDWRTGKFYPVINTEQMWNFDGYNYDLFNTEIARRASLMVQGVAKAAASANRLSSMPLWKQGAMNQGGPADTMLRRMIVPDDFDFSIDVNPYAFENMECSLDLDGDGAADLGGEILPEGVSFSQEETGWILTDGSNPYYPRGICLAPATNLSGNVPDACVDSDTGGEIACPTVASFETGSPFGIGDTNPILQGYIQGEGNTQKALTWHQCPSDGALVAATDGLDLVTCDTDAREDKFVNLRDQSWYNPLDVSKGHRGFIDGDFVMILHAWSPNWRLNAKGNDRYDLFIRRSFDGGKTWTTTPDDPDMVASDGEAFGGDGTVTCEIYRSEETQASGDSIEPRACFSYAAGGAEQMRNVTQHERMRITTLDPRYTPALGTTERGVDPVNCLAGLLPDGLSSTWVCDDGSVEHDSDVRDPSRYMIVYEVGDNSTVELGEAEPLDLFYGRAESFGDDYTVWAETDTATADPSLCYPNDPHGDEDLVGSPYEGSGFCNEFDKMNARNDISASESSLASNADGSKLYGVWTQTQWEGDYENVLEADAMARRVWWIDDYISDDPDLTWTLPGTSQGDGGGGPTVEDGE